MSIQDRKTQLESLARKLAEKGVAVEDIAKKVGRSVSWVRGNIPPHVDIRNLNREIKNLNGVIRDLLLIKKIVRKYLEAKGMRWEDFCRQAGSEEVKF